MEELKDISIHHTALKLLAEIRRMRNEEMIYKTVQVFCVGLCGGPERSIKYVCKISTEIGLLTGSG